MKAINKHFACTDETFQELCLVFLSHSILETFLSYTSRSQAFYASSTLNNLENLVQEFSKKQE